MQFACTGAAGAADQTAAENGYAESIRGRLRDELLNAAVFDGLHDTKAPGAKWRQEYNHRRPHSSLGYVPSAVFAAKLAAALASPPAGAAPLTAARPASHPSTPISSPKDSPSDWCRKWGRLNATLAEHSCY